MPFDPRLPRALRLLPLIAGLAATGIARADDPNPYYIGVSQTVAHESNIYLTPDGVGIPATSAMHYTTALIGGIDQSIGRERLFGNVALRHNAYGGSNSELNNNGYGATLGLDWATVDRISGNFTYRGNRTLSQLNSDTGAVQLEPRQNLGTTNEFDATARVGVVTRLTGILGYTYQKLSYSDPVYASREFHQNTIQAGLNYSSSSALIFGSALRYTRGQFPYTTDPTANDVIAADDFHRNDLDLTAQWIPSGASTLNARVSFSREEHDLSSQRSFSGATGNVNWDWRPTGKLEFITTLSRDTGQQSTFFGQFQNNSLQSATGDISRVTNTLQLEAKYALTSKVSFDALLNTNQRSLANNVSNNSLASSSGHDRSTAAALGVRWTAARSIEVGCNLSNQRRTSDIPVLSLPYSSNSVGCYGQLTLQ